MVKIPKYYFKISDVIPKSRKSKLNRFSLKQHINFVNAGINKTTLKNDTNFDYNLFEFYQFALKNNLFKYKEKIIEKIKERTILEDISLKIRIKEHWMRYLLPWLGIKERPRPYKKRWNGQLRKLDTLTPQQKSIIKGSLLGDASRYCASGLRSIQFAHSIKQKDYLDWKYKKLKNLATKPPITIKYYHKKHKKYYKNVRFYTVCHPEIQEINELFYSNYKKTITKNSINQIDELSLAVWYMDDGTTGWGNVLNNKNKPTAEICTDSYNDNEKSILQELLDKFEIKSKITPRGRITLSTESTEILFSLIKIYIPKCMKYKINRKYTIIYRTNKEMNSRKRD